MMGLPVFKKAIVITFIVGGIAGIVAALAAEKMDRLTTTDEFCTSCHAMQTYIADAETYKTSAHQTAASGVRPRCADCHIPKELVVATYTHVVNGISDLWGQTRFDYEDPEVWLAERARLAYAARDWFRGNDSATCRVDKRSKMLNSRGTYWPYSFTKMCNFSLSAYAMLVLLAIVLANSIMSCSYNCFSKEKSSLTQAIWRIIPWAELANWPSGYKLT